MYVKHFRMIQDKVSPLLAKYYMLKANDASTVGTEDWVGGEWTIKM